MAQQNKKLNNKLISRNFISSIQDIINDIIRYDDVKKAFEISSLLEKVTAKNKSEIIKFKEINDFYEKVIIKTKFIALPLLNNNQIVELVKNNFTWQFRISNYDLLMKLNNKLINIEIYEERDKLKDELKKALLGNYEIISNKAKIRIISEWLKDYNVKLGTGIVDNLKRTQYFTDLSKIKGLNQHNYKEKLKILFDFYERLKFSSQTPRGFEEEIPIVVDNKFYIFKQGILEPIKETNKEISVPEITDSSSSDTRPSRREENDLDKLQQLLNQYPADSLERKAVEEEINKLKVEK